MTVTSNLHVGIAAWAGGQSYAVGNRVSNGGNAYQCVQAGTSGLSGGPSGTGTSIVDGSCRWKYLSAVDFTTISAWLASIPGTRTQAYTGLLWNDGQITTPTDTPFAQFSGHAGGSSTNLITLTCAPGESFTAGKGALTYNASAGVSFLAPSSSGATNYFWIDDSYVVLDGLQIKDPLSTSGCTLIGGGGDHITVQNCIIDGYSQAGGAFLIQLNTTGNVASGTTFRNNVIFDRGNNDVVPTAQLGSGGGSYTVINNTFVLVTYTANAGCLDAGGNTTAQSSLARNNIFINYDQPVVAGSGDNQWAFDHNACTVASFPANGNGTDNGGSIYGLNVSNEFVGSITSDVRLKWGAKSADAAATDTTDLPSAADIFGTSRPQGSAWDIGAFELVPPHQLGTARARGKVTGFTESFPTRGTARARGKAPLVAALNLAARSQSAGRGTVGAALLSFPLGPSKGAGASRATLAQGLYSYALGPARGQSSGAGRAGNPAFAFVSALSRAASVGRSAITVTRLLAAAGRGAADGAFAQQTFAIPLTAAGRAAARGRVPLQVVLSGARARGAATGRSAIASSAALAGRARAAARAFLAAPGLGFAVVSRAAGSGAALLNIALAAASGFAAGRGQAIEGAVEALTSASAATGRGAFGPFTGSLALAAVGTARSYGLTNSVASKPVTARGRAAGRGTQGTQLLYAFGAGGSGGAGISVASRPLATVGRGAGRGRTLPLNSAVALGLGAARGAAQIMGRTSFNPSHGAGAATGNASLSASTNPQARGNARGSGLVPASMTFLARGLGAAQAPAGGVASLPLGSVGEATGRGSSLPAGSASPQASGTGAGSGTAAASLTTALAARGGGTGRGAGLARQFGMMASSARAVGAGRAILSAVVGIAGTGRGAARGAAGLTAGLAGRGLAAASARVLGGPVAFFAAVGRGAASAAGMVLPLWIITGSGRASGAGQLHERLAVAARSAAAARGQAAFNLTLPPVSGRASGYGQGTALPLTLITARGDAGTAGALTLTGLGLTTAGGGAASGSLYRRQFITGSGGGVSSGRAIMSPWHVITPAESGPPLSALSSLPAFDPAMLGDSDFFVFDWGERLSAASDPIVVATVSAKPATITLGVPQINGTEVRVMVSSAVPGTYALRCTVTLLSGRVLHWSVPLQVERADLG